MRDSLYRSEIDGLRALAVLSVILFHFGFKIIPNGFFGVDIFFVISGYLITNILINDLRAGKFSLLNFYERRIRRILPVLIFILLVTSIFAWLWLLPHELLKYGESLFSTSLFHSNIYFANNSGYFDTNSQELPLIHTWSLAVEEQFYFLFPILLYTLWLYCKKPLPFVILILAMISLVYFFINIPKGGMYYFLPHTRAWELLFGSMAAICLKNKTTNKVSIATEIWSILGLFLIYLGMTVNIRQNAYLLGVASFQVCIGTILVVLFCHKDSLISKVLSIRPLVFIGLISYSAYLWHQPIFAFSILRFDYLVDTKWKIFAILMIIGLSWFTWYFIEQPFRNKNFISKYAIFYTSIAFTAILIVLSFFLKTDNGQENRKQMLLAKQYSQYNYQNGWGVKFCESNKIISDLGPIVCKIGDKNSKPHGVIWGDSIAGSLIYGLNEVLIKNKKSFYAVISNGCPPVEGLNHHKHNCSMDRHTLFTRNVIKHSEIKQIIWVGNFINAMNSRGTPVNIWKEPTNENLVARSMQRTANSLVNAGKNVILFSPHPIMPLNTPAFYMRKTITKDPRELIVFRKYHHKRIKPFKLLIQDLPKEIKVFDSEQYFCKSEYCYARDHKTNLLFYSDTIHISQGKSMELANALLIDFQLMQ